MNAHDTIFMELFRRRIISRIRQNIADMWNDAIDIAFMPHVCLTRGTKNCAAPVYVWQCWTYVHGFGARSSSKSVICGFATWRTCNGEAGLVLSLLPTAEATGEYVANCYKSGTYRVERAWDRRAKDKGKEGLLAASYTFLSQNQVCWMSKGKLNKKFWEEQPPTCLCYDTDA